MTVLSRAAITAALNSQVVKNGVGAVTADVLRARFIDIVDSTYNRNDDQGIGGGGGQILTRQASVNISAGTNVVADGATGCKPADPSDQSQVNTLLGIVTSSAVAGATVTVQTGGPITNVTGSFSGGQPLYIGAGGILTSTPPTIGWLQQVGLAFSLNTIVYAPGIAAKIGGGDIILPTGGYATPAGLVASGPVADALSAKLNAPVGAVRKGQFLAAVEAASTGNLATLFANVPSDPGDTTNRAWNHTVAVTPTSTLATFAKATLGLSTPQLAAIFTAAAAITDY